MYVPVSYTHLDVYKRQDLYSLRNSKIPHLYHHVHQLALNSKRKIYLRLFHFLDKFSQKWYERVLTKAPQLQNIHTEDDKRSDNTTEN